METKNYIERQHVEVLLKNQKGKFFTVKFIKKDGSERILTGRLGVYKHLHNGVNTTLHLPQYINVYDVKQKGYRKINLDTISEITCSNKVYTVLD